MCMIFFENIGLFGIFRRGFCRYNIKYVVLLGVFICAFFFGFCIVGCCDNSFIVVMNESKKVR